MLTKYVDYISVVWHLLYSCKFKVWLWHFHALMHIKMRYYNFSTIKLFSYSGRPSESLFPFESLICETQFRNKSLSPTKCNFMSIEVHDASNSILSHIGMITQWPNNYKKWLHLIQSFLAPNFPTMVGELEHVQKILQKATEESLMTYKVEWLSKCAQFPFQDWD